MTLQCMLDLAQILTSTTIVIVPVLKFVDVNLLTSVLLISFRLLIR